MRFRTVLCDMIAQQLSPESTNIVARFQLGEFSSKVVQAYIPSLPSAGREAAPDLAKYCIVVGLLFRAWILYTKGQEGRAGLVAVVDEAVHRREERIKGLKGPARAKVEGVVNREGQMMKVLAAKLAKDTGVA